MASASVSNAIIQTVIGTALAGALEAALPPFTAEVALETVAVEAAVQVGLNALAYTVAARLLRSDAPDPTFGFPFAHALMVGQPGLNARIAILSRAASEQARQVVQQNYYIGEAVRKPGPSM